MAEKKGNNPFAGFNVLNGPSVEDYTDNIEDDADDVETAEEITSKTTKKADIKKAPIKKIETVEDTEEETELTPEQKKAEEDHFKKLKEIEAAKKKTETTTEEVEENVVDIEEEEVEEGSLKPLAEFLSKEGIVDVDLDKFEDTPEALKEIFEQTKTKGIEEGIKSYKDSLPGDIHKLVEFTEAGGDPRQFMDLYYGGTDIASLDMTKAENQKYVIQEGLRLAGWEEGQIAEEIKDYEDIGKLEGKSDFHLQRLKANEENQKNILLKAQKEYRANQIEATNKMWSDLKTDLYSKENINGFKLTPTLKDKIWEHMSKPVDKKTGKTKFQLNNETNKDAQFLYAYLDYLNFDISKLEKQVENKVNSNLRKKLSNITNSDSRNKIRNGTTEIRRDKDDADFSGFKSLV